MDIIKFKEEYTLRKAHYQIVVIDASGYIFDSCNTLETFTKGDNIYELVPFFESLRDNLEALTPDSEPLLFPRVELENNYQEERPVYDFELFKKVIDGTEYLVWVINEICENYDYLSDIVTDRRVSMIENEFLAIKSERIALENELIKLKNEELERNREFKNTFFSKASHELRTPVNGIIGIAEILKQSASATQLQYLNALEHVSRHLVTITNDLLDLAKIESGKFTFEKHTFSLAQVLETARLTFSSELLKSGNKLTIKIDERIPESLLGDSIRLQQILFNLLSNAIKFTRNGNIDVEVAMQGVDDINGIYTLYFSVKDTGSGIAEDKLRDIFEPFVQENEDTYRLHGGTGLGLTIVKLMVELQGGTISIASKPNVGTTLHFSIGYEIAKDALPKEEEIAEIATNKISPDNGLPVLVVDDNQINVMVMAKYLENMKYKVEMARDGVEAVEKASKTQFQMIFMDVEMPEMDGYDATKTIRAMENAKNSQIPIFLLTAYPYDFIKDKMDGIGASGYILKPISKTTLIKVIEEYVE